MVVGDGPAELECVDVLEGFKVWGVVSFVSVWMFKGEFTL